jgi:CDP-diglyceride synthetase
MPDIWFFLTEMFKVSQVSFGIVALLTTLTGLMIKAMTDSSLLTGFFSATNAFGAFAGMYVVKYTGFRMIYDKEANLVVGACAGMLVSFVLMMALMRTIYWLIDVFRKDVTSNSAAYR